MKLKSQLEAYRSIRKQITPPTRIERPVKGSGYNRKNKNWKNYDNE